MFLIYALTLSEVATCNLVVFQLTCTSFLLTRRLNSPSVRTWEFRRNCLHDVEKPTQNTSKLTTECLTPCNDWMTTVMARVMRLVRDEKTTSFPPTCLNDINQSTRLECGPISYVMAAQLNIGGALCDSSVIPLLVPRRKVWLTPLLECRAVTLPI